MSCSGRCDVMRRWWRRLDCLTLLADTFNLASLRLGSHRWPRNSMAQGFKFSHVETGIGCGSMWPPVSMTLCACIPGHREGDQAHEGEVCGGVKASLAVSARSCRPQGKERL